ncbi:right-handed parallel beta-helix repeat-containing protein [Lacinutrix jangbogonensis]|uniref:hypothetical protein n=1 Tax=Lacinutrix jangbogonensis TaxID=1469557 RepID=UPI00053CF8A3|nr:hypothetical protein [Lacinutrix jangbogonensis]
MKTIMLSLTKIAILLCAITITNAQTTFTVDNTPDSGAQFSNLQDAIDAASDGDIIYVQQSGAAYSSTAADGNLRLDKSLTLIGRSHSDEFYRTQIVTLILEDGSSNSIIRGFNITGSGLIIKSLNDNVVLNNYSIEDNFINGVSIGRQSSTQADYTVSNVSVTGNVVINKMDVGTDVSNIILSNNYFTGSSNGGSAFDISEPLNVIISNNIFRPGSGSNFYMRSPGVLNITDSVFLISSIFRISGDFSLNNCGFTNTSGNMVVPDNGVAVQNINNGIFNVDSNDFADCFFNFQFLPRNCDVPAGSPLIGAGANGGNIGFQQNFIFKYLGNPKGVPEVKVTNYTGATTSNGTVTFNIEAKSN